MYTDLAHLWPVISKPEDYAVEAGFWLDALRARLGPGRHEVLYLGAGAGHHMSHLTRDFQITAVDLSREMLALSEHLNPIVKHLVGDMRNLRLGRTFDAVLIHDCIVYMQTEEELEAAFATARAHLEPGGVFITVPDWYRETFPETQVGHWVIRKDDQELTFIECQTDPDSADTTIESVFFYIFQENGQLRIEKDHHVFGLFPHSTWNELMWEAGFDVDEWPCPILQDKRPTNLLVGVAV
jgi:ubiquinone/menaquinone biosynthesis C-methylase UbiE